MKVAIDSSVLIAAYISGRILGAGGYGILGAGGYGILGAGGYIVTFVLSEWSFRNRLTTRHPRM